MFTHKKPNNPAITGLTTLLTDQPKKPVVPVFEKEKYMETAGSLQ